MTFDTARPPYPHKTSVNLATSTIRTSNSNKCRRHLSICDHNQVYRSHKAGNGYQDLLWILPARQSNGTYVSGRYPAAFSYLFCFCCSVLLSAMDGSPGDRHSRDFGVPNSMSDPPVAGHVYVTTPTIHSCGCETGIFSFVDGGWFRALLMDDLTKPRPFFWRLHKCAPRIRTSGYGGDYALLATSYAPYGSPLRDPECTRCVASEHPCVQATQGWCSGS